MTINASHDLVVFVGNDLKIDCIVASLPHDSGGGIRWHYNNNSKYQYEIYCDSPTARVYYIEGDFNKVHCQKIITLIIRNLTFQDSGDYSCIAALSNYPVVTDTLSLTVTTLPKQPDYKLTIIKISIPVFVVIILSAVSMTLGFFYYQRTRQVKLKKALEEYQKRPLPKKGWK